MNILNFQPSSRVLAYSALTVSERFSYKGKDKGIVKGKDTPKTKAKQSIVGGVVRRGTHLTLQRCCNASQRQRPSPVATFKRKRLMRMDGVKAVQHHLTPSFALTIQHQTIRNTALDDLGLFNNGDALQ